MKKICELLINSCEDRASLVSILDFAGYIVEIRDKKSDRYYSSKDYVVVVYEKEVK